MCSCIARVRTALARLLDPIIRKKARKHRWTNSLTCAAGNVGVVPDLCLKTLNWHRTILRCSVGVDVVTEQAVVGDDRSKQLVIGAWYHVIGSRYRRTQNRWHQHTTGTVLQKRKRCHILRKMYTVSQKNRNPVTFSNNSNNPGSIPTNFGAKNRQLIGT